ncbi:hypothetical protein ABZW02_29550 [Streptomyces sp. NPDC005180]|uniref:hypothetical protein n=1 Tax=Streptomyces sp. NPDC005180 TaxID=3156868 RepID=UPI0033A81E1C
MSALQGRPHVILATSKFVAERAQTHTDKKAVVLYPPFATAEGTRPLLAAGGYDAASRGHGDVPMVNFVTQLSSGSVTRDMYC